MRIKSCVCAGALLVWIGALGSLASAQQARQTEQDEYTRYELLAPDTASFAIDYEVTATTPGATLFFNPIRKGSVASNEAVYDMMTRAPLRNSSGTLVVRVGGGADAVKAPAQTRARITPTRARLLFWR